MGLFLCSTESNEILQLLKPEWNDKANLPLTEKYVLLPPQFSLANVFPWHDELSGEIEFEGLSKSFFVQPDVFLRLRPGKGKTVKQKLQAAGILFNAVSGSCLALPNSSRLDDLLELNEEAVVQDYSSQRVGELLSIVNSMAAGASVWDCCAASGGKSIMAKDVFGNIKLTVSDVRESILHSLKKRFAQAGIKKYKSVVADLSGISTLPDQHPIVDGSPYDLIICDAPCTGSGTWSRTPEQVYYFEKNAICKYAALQKQIVSNAIPYLQAGGYLLYITCSVFKKENEEVVDFIKTTFSLEQVKMEVFKGYDLKADTMFAALLQKPL